MERIPVDADGRVDLVALASLLDDEVALVAVMWANNEVGTIEPIAEIAQMRAAWHPVAQRCGADSGRPAVRGCSSAVGRAVGAQGGWSGRCRRFGARSGTWTSNR